MLFSSQDCKQTSSVIIILPFLASGRLVNSNLHPTGAKTSLLSLFNLVGITPPASWYISKSVDLFGSVSHMAGVVDTLPDKIRGSLCKNWISVEVLASSNAVPPTGLKALELVVGALSNSNI